MIFLYLITAGGAYFWWTQHKKLEELDKYEFEHRTAGGVVEFKSFEDAKKHDRRKGVLAFRVKLGAVLTIGGAILIFAVSSFNPPHPHY